MHLSTYYLKQSMYLLIFLTYLHLLLNKNTGFQKYKRKLNTFTYPLFNNLFELINVNIDLFNLFTLVIQEEHRALDVYKQL